MKDYSDLKVDYVVINDGSSDKTSEICKQYDINCINLIQNLGIGGAVQTGYIYAKLKQYDIAVQFDGDGQHDIESLETLVTPILEGQADLVIGSRFIEETSDFKSTFMRRIGINYLSFLIKALTSKKVHDPTSGFRAANKRAINLLAGDYPVDYPEPESIVTLLKNGLTLSAQIMPGMPVLIGFVSMIFGEGKLLWLALKVLWFIMNSFTAFFIYKIVTLYTPKWCGILATLPLFWADFVWMDNLILTETPFLVLFIAMIYFTLMMGKTEKWRYFWLCSISYMLALMFKANIGLYPLFAFVYLLAVKYDFVKLLKQCGILACVVLCFVIPWSIRNYIHYDAFVPLTWGAGNPLLLGTYQGYGYPEDEDLDYETNVEEVAKEKFAKYYDEEGNIINDYMAKYISLEKDGIMAKYRMKVWAKENPKTMFKSYFIEKPKSMIHSVFYWREVFSVPVTRIIFFREINWTLCILTVLAALFVKKYRSIILFLASLYIGNIYIYAMTFAFDRYAATLLPLRFITIGIGIMVFVDLLKCVINKFKGVKASN